MPRAEAVILRWARRKLLRVDLIHNLPKSAQRDFIDALLDAYVRGYEAATNEMQTSQPLDGGSNVQLHGEGPGQKADHRG